MNWWSELFRGKRSEAFTGGMGERYCSQKCYDAGGATVTKHLLDNWTGDCSVCRGDVALRIGERASMVCWKPGLFLFHCGSPSCAAAVKKALRETNVCPICGAGLGGFGLARSDAPVSQRVKVGRCDKCGRDLRVKAAGVRPEMRLTCKCGHANVVRDEAAPGKEEAKAHTRDEEVLETLRRLCVAYAENDTAGIARLEPIATKIGQELNRRGGIDEMRRIWNRLGRIRGATTLEMHWDGIGEWRG